LQQSPGTDTIHDMLRGSRFPADSVPYTPESVRAFFDNLFLNTGLPRSDTLRRAGIPLALGHQILTGVRRGNRSYVLRLALAMGLDLSVTQMMLAQTGNAALYPKMRSDAAMIFCINNRYSPERADVFLMNLAAPLPNAGFPAASEAPGTGTVQQMLRQDIFPDALPAVLVEEDMPALTDRFIARSGLTKAQVIERSLIPRALAYQIMNGQRTGKRDYILCLVFALGLDEHDAQYLLRVSGNNALHPKIQRDAAILFCINNRYSLSQCYWFLEQLKLIPLDTGDTGHA